MPNERYIQSLTSLRGLAAAAVLVFHCVSGAFGGTEQAGLSLIPRRGYLAVDLFFILSGFVLAHVHGSEFAAGFDRAKFARFLWARVARIYPVHLLMLFVLLPFAGGPGYSAFAFLMNLLIMHGPWLSSGTWNGISWSISAEWHAYLLFPLIVPLALRPRPAVAVGAGLACLSTIAALTVANGWTLSLITHGPAVLARALPEFVIGVLAYRIYASGGNALRILSSDWLFGAVIVDILALAATWPTDIAIVCFLPLLLLCTATNHGRISQVFSTKPLVFLGDISYSLYMTHLTCIEATFWLVHHAIHSEVPSTIMFLLFAGVSLIAATIVSRCVEWPARSLLRNFGRSRDLAIAGEPQG